MTPNKMKDKRFRKVIYQVSCWFLFCLSQSLFAADYSTDYSTDYYPEKGDWKRKLPQQVGMDADKLAQAVEFAQSIAETEPDDLAPVIAKSFAREPYFKLLGPTLDRKDSSGLIIKNGYIVAEWGDIHKVDMTFSVTKSYLSTVADLAQQQGLIESFDDRVGDYVKDGKFDSEHNQSITWKHLLQQTSDWQGELWSQPDWADRPIGDDIETMKNRELHQPGTFYKYNDVRVNLLAYSLLKVLNKSLPQVLKEKVMQPIGASNNWQWHGYHNSWVQIGDSQIQSVSGGGHWGGGMFISTEDHARFGYLFLRQGKWQDKQLISKQWIKEMRQPADARDDYGYMWWLNTDQKRLAAASADSYYGAGFGGNYIWIDEELDLLVVVRWIPDLNAVLEKVLLAI